MSSLQARTVSERLQYGQKRAVFMWDDIEWYAVSKQAKSREYPQHPELQALHCNRE